jgi:hypothetical protein
MDKIISKEPAPLALVPRQCRPWQRTSASTLDKLFHLGAVNILFVFCRVRKGKHNLHKLNKKQFKSRA